MTRTRKTRLLLAALGVGVVGVMVAVAQVTSRSRTHRLDFELSRIDSKVKLPGTILKVESLAPRGWKRPGYFTKSMISRALWSLDLRPELQNRDSVSGYFHISVGEYGSHVPGDGVVHVTMQHHPGQQFYVARRQLVEPPGCIVEYSLNEKETFQATYRQICESFQVIKEL